MSAPKKSWVAPDQYWKQRYLAERGYDAKTWKSKKTTRRAEGRMYDRKSPADKAAYYKSKVKKDGKTPGFISKGGSSMGGIAGTYLGGPVGGAVGSFLGGKIGHLVEKITGFGDYNVVENSIMKGGLSPPTVVNTTNKGGVIVRHREYIGDVLATSAFTLQTFTINPGLLNSLQGAFPWLAQIANSYEQYRFRGLLFEFQSTSSDALLSSATSTALGTVSMATQYDVSQPLFSDKRTMLNYEYANSRKPSCTFIHPVECKQSQTPLKYYFTRSGAVPSGADPGRFDFCRFSVATEGMQAPGGVLGELWVTYEVEFLKQQFEQSAFTDHFQIASPGSNSMFGAPGTQQATNIARGGTIGGSITGTGQTYSFPPLLGSGMYLITYQCTGAAAAALGPPAQSFTNCVAVPFFNNNGSSFISNGASTANVFMAVQLIRVLKQGAAFSWSAVGLPGGSPVTADLVVSQVASSLQ